MDNRKSKAVSTDPPGKLRSVTEGQKRGQSVSSPRTDPWSERGQLSLDSGCSGQSSARGTQHTADLKNRRGIHK